MKKHVLGTAIADDVIWRSTSRQLDELEANLAALATDLDMLRHDLIGGALRKNLE